MFKIVRQPLFNADGDIGGGQPAGGSEPASSSSAEGITPGWGLPQGTNQAAANPLFSQEPAVAPVAPEPAIFDFAGRKIEVADPSIAAALKDVHKDYSALQGTYTQTNQRVKELEQANQTYANLLQTIQQQGGQQPNAMQSTSQQGQPAPEDLEQMKADFMEQFYDDPKTAIEGLLDSMFQQRVQPIIEPITQERQWNEQVQTLQQKYPDDFQQMVGPMQQLLQDMPELAQHGLESVFLLAKRSQPMPQPGPDQLLNDPNFRQQVMANPDIQKQFLSQYLQEKQGSQQQAPTVMGGQPGGQMPATPEQRPKDIRTASQAFKKSLGIF